LYPSSEAYGRGFAPNLMGAAEKRNSKINPTDRNNATDTKNLNPLRCFYPLRKLVLFIMNFGAQDMSFDFRKRIERIKRIFKRAFLLQ
jgi:hypothetical protein